MPLALECLDEARALLNDLGGVVYGNSDLLPYLKKAYRELQVRLFRNQIQASEEISSDLKVTAGQTDLDSVPADLVYPIYLEERPYGSTQLHVQMVQREWEPTAKPVDSLRYWVWREEAVQFLGATTDRAVRMRYAKALSVISDVNSNIPVANSTTFLGARTASLAALYIGENVTRAKICGEDAAGALNELVGLEVRRKQALPVRRQRNRYRR